MLVSGRFDEVEEAIKWWAANNSPEWDFDYKDNGFGHEIKVFDLLPDQSVVFEIEPIEWEEPEDVKLLGPFKDSMSPAVLILQGWDFVLDELVAVFTWRSGYDEV
jgi:hypothetical protein